MRCGVAGVLLALALTDARPRSAGRDILLILPFDIADAQSLPWEGGVCCGRPGYDIAHLLRDTEALLTPSTPIIVRLETLRRAVVYASSDRRLAVRLLTRFTERMRPEARGQTSAAVAALDAAFVVEAFRQIEEHPSKPFTRHSRQVRGLVSGTDGYALLRASVPIQSNDPEFDFAAALIAGARHVDEPAFALRPPTSVGGDRDPLVVRNHHRIYGNHPDPAGVTLSNRNRRRPSVRP
jgi:hypothetical protein